MSEGGAPTDPLAVRSLLVDSDVADDEEFDDELIDDIVTAVVSARDFDAPDPEPEKRLEHTDDPESDAWDESRPQLDRNHQANRVSRAVNNLRQAINGCDAEHVGVLATIYRDLTVKAQGPISEGPHEHLRALENELERLARAAEKTKTKRGTKRKPYTRMLTEVAQALKRFGDNRQVPLALSEGGEEDPAGEYAPLQRDRHLSLVIREVMSVVGEPVSEEIQDKTLVRYAQEGHNSLMRGHR